VCVSSIIIFFYSFKDKIIRDSGSFAGHHHLLMLFRTSGGESRDRRSKRFVKLRKKESEFRTDTGGFVQKSPLQLGSSTIITYFCGD
jgi:hypothetical protein